MDTRSLAAVLLVVIVFVFSGCGVSPGQSSTSSGTSSPASVPQEDSSVSPVPPAEEAPSASSGTPDSAPEESSSSGAASQEILPPDKTPDNPRPAVELMLPPPVPSGEELEGLDFSAMDKEALIDLLQPVLDRAEYFCDFATLTEMEGIGIDYELDSAILRPFRIWEQHYFHPYTNLPYHTLEDLKADMATVFTPDNMEDETTLGRYVLGENQVDDGERIYFAAGLSGFTVASRWELDGLEIVSAGKTELTISAPVSQGPYVNPVMAPLHFEVQNGYIVMDDTYFAASVQDELSKAN